MNILEKLFNGEIAPVEEPVARTEEYDRLIEKQERLAERFGAQFTSMERACFSEYRDLQHDREAIYASQTFSSGFRLGVELMVEALRGGVRGDDPQGWR